LIALATEPAVVASPFKVEISLSIPSSSSLIASRVAASSLESVPLRLLIAVSIWVATLPPSPIAASILSSTAWSPAAITSLIKASY